MAQRVTVFLDYSEQPDKVSMHADISTASGWHTRLPLTSTTSFVQKSTRSTATLDLLDLQARAYAAAAATGLPADEIRVRVVGDIVPGSGARFSPGMTFALTPLQLSLAEGGPLVTPAPAAAARSVPLTGQVLLLGRKASALAVRRVSAALVALGLLAALVTALLARRGDHAPEEVRIRRRYAAMLLPVQPMSSVPGRPVVDVADFTALVRLAERYGLLILHWTRSGVATYVVPDEGTTYRYRTGAGSEAGMPIPPLGLLGASPC